MTGSAPASRYLCPDRRGLLAISPQASAQGSRCTDEAASLRRAETQLPRLDVAPPDDQQIVCITLETNIAVRAAVRRPSRQLPALAACPRRGGLAADRLAIHRAVQRAALQTGDPRLSRITFPTGPSKREKSPWWGSSLFQLSSPSAERRAAWQDNAGPPHPFPAALYRATAPHTLRSGRPSGRNKRGSIHPNNDAQGADHASGDAFDDRDPDIRPLGYPARRQALSCADASG